MIYNVISTAIYSRHPYKDFTFIALDKSSTDIGIYDVSEEFYKRGEHKFNRAIGLYRDFFVKNQDLDTYTIRETL